MSEPGKLKQLFSPSNWLLSGLLAIGGTLGAGFVAVLAGWWEVLSKAILPQTTDQQLLDTIGILILSLLAVSFFLIQRERLIRKLRTPKRRSSESSRLPELQERLLVIAANTPVREKTLHDEENVHLEESKYHFDCLVSRNLLQHHSPHLKELSQAGRKYLLKYGLMPKPVPPAHQYTNPRRTQAAPRKPRS